MENIEKIISAIITNAINGNAEKGKTAEAIANMVSTTNVNLVEIIVGTAIAGLLPAATAAEHILAQTAKTNGNASNITIKGNYNVIIPGNNTGNICINVGAANKESASTGNSVNADSVGSGFGIVAKKGVILGAPKAKCKYLAAVAMKTVGNEIKFVAKIKNCFDGDSIETINGDFENKGKDLNRGLAVVEVLKQTSATDGQICFNIFGVGSADIKDAIFKTAAEKQLYVVGISTKTSNFINGTVDKIKPMLQALYEQAAADLEEAEGAEEAEPTQLPVSPVSAVPTLNETSKKEKRAKATSTAKMPKLALSDNGTLMKGGEQ